MKKKKEKMVLKICIVIAAVIFAVSLLGLIKCNIDKKFKVIEGNGGEKKETVRADGVVTGEKMRRGEGDRLEKGLEELGREDVVRKGYEKLRDNRHWLKRRESLILRGNHDEGKLRGRKFKPGKR